MFFAPNVYSIDALVPRCHRHLQQPPDSLGRGFKVSRSTASPQHRSGRQSTVARYAPMSCTPTLWALRVSFLAMPHPNQDVLTKLHSSQRPALTKAIPSLRHLQDASRSPPQQPGPPFLHTFHVGGKRNPQIQEKETLKSIHPLSRRVWKVQVLIVWVLLLIACRFRSFPSSMWVDDTFSPSPLVICWQ